MTNRPLLKRLHEELRDAHKNLDTHIKVMGRCYSSCAEGAELRTVIEIYKRVIRLAGGRA